MADVWVRLVGGGTETFLDELSSDTGTARFHGWIVDESGDLRILRQECRAVTESRPWEIGEPLGERACVAHFRNGHWLHVLEDGAPAI